MYQIGNNWDKVLKAEFDADYFRNIAQTLEQEYENYIIYPPSDRIFTALQTVDFPAVKVCILGQDPYHGAGQANGMAFAVCKGVQYPPSLGNIFAELKNDLGTPLPKSGTLTGWAKQGVLLLNASLTVREGQPQSHANLGWHIFTDAVIQKLSDRAEPVVFILWGSSAIAKAELIAPHHHIISSPHPSPLSAHRGFFGSKPFSRANAFLKTDGVAPIDWSDVEGIRASYYNAPGSIKKI